MKKTLFRFVSMFILILISSGTLIARETSPPDLTVLGNYTIIDANRGEVVSEDDFKKDLSHFDVIYALEAHGDWDCASLQTELWEMLNNPDAVFAHEHFRKNAWEHQLSLDSYTKGNMSDSQFFANRNLGWLFKEYPAMLEILDSAKRRQSNLLAINIPKDERGLPSTTVTVESLRKKILGGGFDSLSAREKSFFPSDGFRMLCTEESHGFIMAPFEMMGHGSGAMSKFSVEDIHVGYWIMNEVMGKSILDYFEGEGDEHKQLVVGAGRNHGFFNSGIRASVAARNPDLKQVTVIVISEDEAIEQMRGIEVKDKMITKVNAIDFLGQSGIADYVILDGRESETSSKFKEEVNDRIREIGRKIELPPKKSIECKIMGPFEAIHAMSGYTGSIRGLYANHTLDFIQRGRHTITSQSARALVDHEGVHGLQDQYFDLGNIEEIQMKSHYDKGYSIQALIEGHASYAMIFNYGDQSRIGKMLDMPFVNKRGKLASLDKIFFYSIGAKFVKYLHEQGGWELVNYAFRNLPVSSEQLMHPDKYIGGEEPVYVSLDELNLPDVVMGEDEVGEIRMAYNLMTFGVPEEQALEAAAGWDGDKNVVYYNEERNRVISEWKVVFESEKDAEEFLTAYVLSSNNIFGVNYFVEHDECMWAAESILRTVRMADKNIYVHMESEPKYLDHSKMMQ